MSGFVSFIKSLFGRKKPSPREMAEAQIRRIEAAVMEYNSKDRSLHRDKELAIAEGKEADAKFKKKQSELDALQEGEDSFSRAELESKVAELEGEVEKAKSKMELADGNILKNRKLLEGAEKTLIRLKGALEAGMQPTELLQVVKEVAEMGGRYDMAVDDAYAEIDSLAGSGVEEARRNRREAAEKSEERRRRLQSATESGARTQAAPEAEQSPRTVSASQH